MLGWVVGLFLDWVDEIHLFFVALRKCELFLLFLLGDDIDVSLENRAYSWIRNCFFLLGCVDNFSKMKRLRQCCDVHYVFKT